MKQKLLLLCLWGILALFSKVNAQVEPLYQSHVGYYDSSGVTFYVPQSLVPGDLFGTYHDHFFQGDGHTMVLTKSWTDSTLGMNHYRYQQHFEGIPVEGAEYIEHAADGWLVFANGKVANGIAEPPSGVLSPSEAFTKLMDTLVGYEVAWAFPEWEAQIKTDMNDPEATLLPTGKLTWALIDPTLVGADMDGSNFRLAYTFDVLCIYPSLHRLYYVDAVTGELFREVELSCTNGPATLLSYGTQTIDTKWTGTFGRHILQTNDNGRVIHTKEFGDATDTWSDLPEIKDFDDDWDSDHQKATTPHWMVSQAWDMFSAAPFNRPGMDGNNMQLRIYADWSEPNSKYDRIGSVEYMLFGNLLDGTYLVAIDICGHEYGHGIDAYTASLVYESETGALDESYADIYGFLVERYTDGGVNDWTIGEDAFAVRSLQNPSLFSQPDTYLGTDWAPTANPSQFNDYGGVHTNSGVQNYWFYLLSQGGTGVNDYSYSYAVNGIGIDDAGLIAYWTHTNAMLSNSTYFDAQALSVAAAIVNFGFCSPQHRETENAWAAVGLGGPSNCPVTEIAETVAAAAPKISAFPNPTSDELTLSLELKGRYDLKIVNSEGKVVHSEQNCLGFTKTIPTSGLSSGLYFVSVTCNGKISSTKFVKQD